jgi:hypothetical protein
LLPNLDHENENDANMPPLWVGVDPPQGIYYDDDAAEDLSGIKKTLSLYFSCRFVTSMLVSLYGPQ